MGFPAPSPPASDPEGSAPYEAGNIRLYVPKVARALYGPTYTDADAEQVLSGDQIKDLVADAIANIIFYTRGLWPYTLNVTETTAEGYPYEYQINGLAPSGVPIVVSSQPPIYDETLIVKQAALDFFFWEFKDKKVQEEISDVAGQKWVYGLSANMLNQIYTGLRADRDEALKVVSERYSYLVDYVSFIAERDALTSAMVEWWVRPGLTYPSGQEIFPSVAAFGG